MSKQISTAIRPKSVSQACTPLAPGVTPLSPPCSAAPEATGAPSTGKVFSGADKSTLHKREGTYYLSAGTRYATSKSVYGPYTFRGDSVGKHPSQSFGLTGQAHGRFFEWRGQWFHVYCLFVDNNAAEKVATRTP